MDADKILKNAKLSAGYKWAISVLVFLSNATIGYAVMFVLFTQYTPKHRCKIRELDSLNRSSGVPDEKDIVNQFIPEVLKDGKSVPSSCTLYNYTVDVHNISFLKGPLLEHTSIYNNTVTCQEMYFETDNDGGPTFISEMGLVCDRAWIEPLMISLMMTGKAIGIPFTGTISDKFGRRPALLLSAFTLTGSLVGIAVSTTIYTYAFCITLVGASTLSINTILFVFVSEMVVPEMRGKVSPFFNLSYDFGYATLAAIAYFSSSWRWLVGIIAIISSSLCVIYCCIPETLHWLISNGKYSKVKKLTLRLNGSEEEVDINLTMDNKVCEADRMVGGPIESRVNQETFWSLLKDSVMRRRLLVCCFNWFTVGFIYFALALNADLLTGSRYVVCALSAIMEIVPTAIVYVSVDRIGRPKISSFCCAICGLVCMTVPMFKMWSGHAVTALAVLAQASMSGFFIVIYLHTTEIAPTRSRNIFIGISSSCARIGSILSPYVMFLGEKYVDSYVPYLIMGGFAITAAILNIVYLPETMKMPLPTDIKDARGLKTVYQMRKERKKMMTKQKKKLSNRSPTSPKQSTRPLIVLDRTEI